MNGDCAIIRILPKYKDLLDYNFLYFEIQKLLIEKNFNWENKATPNKVYPLNINIPVSKKGIFDIKDAINLVADRLAISRHTVYLYIRQIKQEQE